MILHPLTDSASWAQITQRTFPPQFADSTKDAKVSTSKFNVHTLRSQIELYKSQHDGEVPTATLQELTSRTQADGTLDTSGPYGPYLRAIPDNPFNGKNTVKTITAPATASDTTGNDGWLYDPTTGDIYIDHDPEYQE